MTQFKLRKLNHIFNCDLLNKYVSNNVFEIPNFKNITIKLNLNDVLKANENVVEGSNKEKELKIKAFLLLFYYFFNRPYYSIQKLKGVKKDFNKEIQLKYFLQLMVSNKSGIQDLLFNLFIENKVLVNNQGKNSFNHVVITSIFDEKYRVLNLLISARLLENFDKTGKFVFNNNFIKQVNFQFLFSILKPLKVLNVKNLAQNLPFFWING